MAKRSKRSKSSRFAGGKHVSAQKKHVAKREREKKGHVPIEVLVNRRKRLNNIIVKRGGTKWVEP